MKDSKTDIALKGIVEGYFKGQDLTELMKAGKDSVIVSRLQEGLLNFKG